MAVAAEGGFLIFRGTSWGSREEAQSFLGPGFYLEGIQLLKQRKFQLEGSLEPCCGNRQLNGLGFVLTLFQSNSFVITCSIFRISKKDALNKSYCNQWPDPTCSSCRWGD